MTDKTKEIYAFPSDINLGPDSDNADWTHTGGMTLRDYFAAKAMQSLINAGTYASVYPEQVGRAYAVANEMMKARSK